MELINLINELLVKAIALAWDALVHLDVADLQPARLDSLINGSTAAVQVRSVLEMVSIVACVVLGAVLATAVSRKRALKSAKPTEAPVAAESSVPPAGALRDRWAAIMAHMDSAQENDWRTAVMEGDKLVDSALQSAGFPGDTFGDRLTNIAPGSLVSLDGLWWAHRIRNRVAHEMDYFLRYTEARQAVSYFQATLEELQQI